MRKSILQQDAPWRDQSRPFVDQPYDPPFEHDALNQYARRKIKLLEAEREKEVAAARQTVSASSPAWQKLSAKAQKVSVKAAARQKVSAEEKRKHMTPNLIRPFQVRMGHLIQSFQSQVLQEKPFQANEITRGAFKSLETHLRAIHNIVGPGGSNHLPVWYYSVHATLEDESTRAIIKDFPKSVATMLRLVEKSRKKETFKMKPTAAKISHEIACEAARLLADFEIPVRIYFRGITSAWAFLTRFMIYHVYGRNETEANLKNILGEAREILKEEGFIFP